MRAALLSRQLSRLLLPLLAAALLPGCSDADLRIGALPVTIDDDVTPGPAPASPPSGALPFAVDGWTVGPVFSSSNDAVADALDAGTFEIPAAGDNYLGVVWSSITPGDNHALIDSPTDLLYAAALVDVPEGQRLFARGDVVTSFRTNGRRQPGDIYGHGSSRVPLGTRTGANLLVVRALGRRATPRVQLWSTSAEVVFNTADATRPDLRVGHDEALPLGVHVLHMGDRPITALRARVIESEWFAATEVLHPAMAASSVSQVQFLLQPKAPIDLADAELPVRLRISSPDLTWTYEHHMTVPTVAAGSRFRRTRVSHVDGSVQYYSVMPPTDEADRGDYGLILSLHGAGVEGSGQAASYSPKNWAYLAAPTNRRRYGFDWEEWGRLDAIEALDHAVQSFAIDERRVHLTGHSMGGHGSWHVGVHFAERFGVVAPSAGWISFDKYGGAAHPTGPVGRARAASQTLDFVQNFADSSVFIIHGSADNNVPVSHAREMNDTLAPIAAKLDFHEEPGAGHWWDLDGDEAGADCVDWEPMIDVMESTQRAPLPLAFEHVSPAPWINPARSYVTVRSASSPMENVGLSSELLDADSVALTTTNVRSLQIDADTLKTAGISDIEVDGTLHAVEGGTIEVGPQGGKTPAAHGPLNQVFHRPWCFVWDELGAPVYREYAAWLTSYWALIGNGRACGVSLRQLNDELVANHNLVWLGVATSEIAMAESLPFAWNGDSLTVGDQDIGSAALAFVYRDGDKLAAYIQATSDAEHLLFRYTPFSSRSGMPDFFVWAEDGLVASGFFDGDWQLEPSYAVGL